MLATALWLLGDVAAARRQFDLAWERAVEAEEVFEQVAVAGQRKAFGEKAQVGDGEVAEIRQRLGVVRLEVALPS